MSLHSTGSGQPGLICVGLDVKPGQARSSRDEPSRIRSGQSPNGKEGTGMEEKERRSGTRKGLGLSIFCIMLTKERTERGRRKEEEGEVEENSNSGKCVA